MATTSSRNQPSRLTELSKIIAEKTAIIDGYLTEKNLPQPSFDPDGPAELGPIARGDEHVQKARIELIDATKELRDLAIGPADSLRYLPWDVRIFFSMYIVVTSSLITKILFHDRARTITKVSVQSITSKFLLHLLRMR
jgi:hypothetical protein